VCIVGIANLSEVENEVRRRFLSVDISVVLRMHRVTAATTWMRTAEACPPRLMPPRPPCSCSCTSSSMEPPTQLETAPTHLAIFVGGLKRLLAAATVSSTSPTIAMPLPATILPITEACSLHTGWDRSHHCQFCFTPMSHIISIHSLVSIQHI
jgi:hypothetical protein